MERITNLMIILLLLLGLSSSAQAQGWTKVIDKQASNDLASKMVKTTGGHILTGPITNGYYLMKIDSEGNEVWHQTHAAASNIVFRGLEVFSNGDILFMGIEYIGGQSPGTSFLARHSSTGTLLWKKSLYQVTPGATGNCMLVLPGDSIFVGGQVLNTTSTPQELEVLLYKLTGSGDSVKQVIVADADTFGVEVNFATLGHNNTIVIVGRGSNEPSDVTLRGFDFGLNPLWAETMVLGTSNDILIATDLIPTSDGGYLTTGYQIVTGGPNGIEGFAYFVKTLGQGQLRWFKQFHQTGDISNGTAIAEPTPGKYALMCMGLLQTAPSTYYNGRPYMVFTDSLGNELYHKIYPGPSYVSLVQMRDLNVMDDKGFLMCGGTGQGVVDQDIYLIRTDSLGNIYKSLIKGNVFADTNENCTQDGGELSLKQWLVTATSATDSFFGVSDALGNYEISCDTGSYALKAIVPNAYWVDTLCSDSLNAQVLVSTDTLVKNLPVGKAIDCPALQVTVDAVFLRRCLPGPAYVVNYCNQGTAEAQNSYVEIALDSYLVLDSASLAFSSLGNNRFRFDLGTIGVNDCGSFNMHIRVDCGWLVPGSAYCVEADIFPNTSCVAPSPLWDNARLDLSTDCQPDSLAFMLQNTGTGNMSTSRRFTIIQDDVMYVQGNVPPLLSGQTFTYKVPSNGATWTFITEQTPSFPGNNRLVSSVEACGTNGNGQFSIGYLMQYPQIGPDVSSDELCLIAVGSYDPNDKAVEPQGTGLEGMIDKDQKLTSRIRFQNTGTDTAFLVVILDTLSANLDVATIRNIRSSHAMELDVLPGNVLQVVYNNILLPDSNVNEPASHGFVSFDIDLVNDLAVGTQITNTAFIYFDQNPAVITNTTLNTIGEFYKTWLSVTEINDPENRVALYPNPTQGMLNLEITGAVSEPVTFSVFDLSGKLIQQQTLPAGTQHQLHLDLNNGMYLFQITCGSQRLGTGKLIAY